MHSTAVTVLNWRINYRKSWTNSSVHFQHWVTSFGIGYVRDDWLQKIKRMQMLIFSFLPCIELHLNVKLCALCNVHMKMWKWKKWKLAIKHFLFRILFCYSVISINWMQIACIECLMQWFNGRKKMLVTWFPTIHGIRNMKTFFK